jgi:hypothetical protein
MPAVTRFISLTNFCVATSALGFQVFVLYPWHHQLQHDFEDLKTEHLRVLKLMASSASHAGPGSPADAASPANPASTASSP